MDKNEDLEIRIKKEKEIYNRGLNRSNYDLFFDYINRDVSYQLLETTFRELLTQGKGKKVLELGSEGFKEINFKQFPPEQLICFNISDTEVRIGLKNFLKSSISSQVNFLIMDAHRLGLKNESVDIVFGSSILHHLEFKIAISEIYRVLKPGGEIIFLEPLRFNPIAMLIRFLTPAFRTPNEKPLGTKELAYIEQFFKLRNRYFQFCSIPFTLLSKFFFKNPINPITQIFSKVDLFLESNFSFLKPFFRIVIIHGMKDKWRKNEKK